MALRRITKIDSDLSDNIVSGYNFVRRLGSGCLTDASVCADFACLMRWLLGRARIG